MPVTRRIYTSGHSYVVSLSQAHLDHLGVVLGSTVEISKRPDQTILIRRPPARLPQPRKRSTR